MPMEIYTMDSGHSIELLEKAFITLILGLDMKASGDRTNSTVMDNSFGLMDQFIVGNIIKEKNKDTENLFGKIKVLTKDNLEIIK